MIRSQAIPRKIFIELVEKSNACEALCLRHVLFMVSEKATKKIIRSTQLQIKIGIKGICYRPVIGMF